MSIRTETLCEIDREIANRGYILLSKQGIKEAIVEHEQTRSAYEQGRKRLLRYRLGWFFGVAYYGSARLEPDSPESRKVQEIAREFTLATGGDSVSGGGPGVMTAAHHGAILAIIEAEAMGRKIKSKNHGVTIDLPTAEKPNGLMHFQSRHPDFSTRLQDFIDLTRAAYFAPGGLGTFLELAVTLQLKQVNHLENDYPIIADPFWKPIMTVCYREMFENRVKKDEIPFIDKKDMCLVKFTDSVTETVGIMTQAYRKWRYNYRDLGLVTS